MWRATLKELLARSVRLALTALSVVLGVGFVAGTYVLTDTMNAAFDQLFTDAAAGSDVVVRAEHGLRSERDRTGERRERGTRSGPGHVACPRSSRSPASRRLPATCTGCAQMVDPATGDPIGGVGPPTIGTNWTEHEPRPCTIREGAPPSAADDVVIDAATATPLQPDGGSGRDPDPLRGSSRASSRSSGTVGFGDADNLGGATLAVVRPADRPAGARQGGRIRFDLRASATRARTAERAAGLDPGRAAAQGVEAVTSTSVADEQSDQLKEGLGFFRTALLVFAFIALFVGLVHHLQHVLDHRRPADPRARPAARARREPPPGDHLGGPRGARASGSSRRCSASSPASASRSACKALLAAFNIDLPSTSLQLLPRTIVVVAARRASWSRWLPRSFRPGGRARWPRSRRCATSQRRRRRSSPGAALVDRRSSCRRSGVAPCCYGLFGAVERRLLGRRRARP